MIKSINLSNFADNYQLSSDGIWVNPNEYRGQDQSGGIWVNPNEKRSGESDDDFPVMGDDEKVPDYEQYDNIEIVSDKEIRITYRSDDGEVLNRTVMNDNAQFADIKADAQLFDAVEEAKADGYEIGGKFPEGDDVTFKYPAKDYMKGLGDRALLVEYQEGDNPPVKQIIINDLNERLYDKHVVQKTVQSMEKDGYNLFTSSDDLPPPERITYFSEDEGDRINFEYLDGNGDTQKGAVLKNIDEDLFNEVDAIRDRWVDQENKIETIEADGYARFEGDAEIPKSGQFISFGDIERIGNETGFKVTYVSDGEEKKAFVLKSELGDEKFEKFLNERDRTLDRQKWMDLQNKNVDEDDPSFISYAKPGNYYEKVQGDDGVTYKKSDEYFVEENAWMDIEAVPELGDDMLLVTTYDSDKRENVVRRQLVSRDMIGDEKYGKLTGGENYDKYVEFFESKGGVLFSSDTIDSQELLNASYVVTDFIDKGFIIVRFTSSGESSYMKKTLVISEKDSPEAFDTVRNYAKSDSANIADISEFDDGDEWVNLRDNNEFPS